MKTRQKLINSEFGMKDIREMKKILIMEIEWDRVKSNIPLTQKQYYIESLTKVLHSFVRIP